MTADTVDRSAKTNWRLVAFFLATSLTGIASLSLALDDVLVFKAHQTSMFDIHPRTFVTTIAPGIAGAALVGAAYTNLLRARVGPIAYFLSLLICTGALLLRNWPYVGIERVPGYEPQPWWMYPDFHVATLENLMSIAAFGLLVQLTALLSNQRVMPAPTGPESERTPHLNNLAAS